MEGTERRATRELGPVASEILRTVRVMDGRNWHRFADQEQLLAWIIASTVLGTPKPGTQSEEGCPQVGEVRPAA